MPPLRLAVDARVISEDLRGIGRYARAVLRRLAPRDDVALTLLANGPFPGRARAGYARALGSDRFATSSRVGRNHDLVWHPANGTFFASALPSVATIHDAVPFRYPVDDPKHRERIQAPFLRSARTATRVITVSNFGRNEAHECLGVPLERIDVIYHGVDPSFTPGPAQPLPAVLNGLRFFLFVGDPIGEPRKNFPLLYEAFRREWPEFDGPTLAVAGPRAPDLPGVLHIGNLGDDLNAGSGVEALRACYRGAIAATMPSYHESFGMPIVEAMASGTPVLASRASCFPEIGGDAPLFLPPDDADAWAAALRRVADDAALSDQLRTAGIVRAQAFTWERSVAQHLAVFHAVAR